MLKPIFNLVSAAGLFCSSGGVSAQTETHTIQMLNWTNYLSDRAVDSLLKDKGIDLVVETYEQSDFAEALLISRGTGYDLAVVSNEAVGRLQAAGSLQILSETLPRKVAGQNFQVLQALYEEIGHIEAYAVPYLLGTTGLVIDADKVAKRLPNGPIDSWALLFDPENAKALEDCGITIVDSNEEVVAAALAYLGKDPRSNADGDVNSALDVLETILPYIRAINTNQRDDLSSGDACLSLSWSSEAFAAMQETNRNLLYMLPRQGASIWADFFVIPVDAAQPELAQTAIAHFSSDVVHQYSVEDLHGFTETGSDLSADSGRSFDGHDARLFVTPQYDGDKKRALDRRWRNLMIQAGQ